MQFFFFQTVFIRGCGCSLILHSKGWLGDKVEP